MTVSADDVRAAAVRVAGVAVRTPAVRLPGADVWLKLESLQRTGAFKFRGAYNLVAQLDPEARAHGLVAGSSGNHALAVALAARLHGVPATIVMPTDAPVVKRAGTEALGARVVGYERLIDDREALIVDLASKSGAVAVPSFDDERIVAGAGTAALELVEDVEGLDAVVLPTSGGGSLAGWSVALPDDIELYGACPQAADAPRRSLATGRRERVAPGPTIADGLQVPMPGAVNFALWSRRVRAIVSVTDDEIVAALRLLAFEGRVVAEPSGAVALAAVAKLDLEGRRVGVLVSGGNVDPGALAGFLL